MSQGSNKSQVKEKHDTVHRLWLSLPTDAELIQRQSLTAEQMVGTHVWLSPPIHSTSLMSHTLTLLHTHLTHPHTPLQHSLPRTSITDNSDDGNLLTGLTEEESSFCSRFQLSPDELPLPSWTLGRRCTLLDKDHPLTGTKSGKLFLTHRWGRMIMVGLNDNENCSILLSFKMMNFVSILLVFWFLNGRTNLEIQTGFWSPLLM